jgi:hypothetical protein
VFGPDVRAETFEFDGGNLMSRGGAWQPGVLTAASDPRLEGTLSVAANSNQLAGAGGPVVWNEAFRIENDEGAWQQTPTIDLDFPGAHDITIGVMVGEGGYAGLIAVFDNVTTGEVWDLHPRRRPSP